MTDKEWGRFIMKYPQEGQSGQNEYIVIPEELLEFLVGIDKEKDGIAST